MKKHDSMRFKVCIVCNNKYFQRNYFGKRWASMKFCSHACFGKHDGKMRKANPIDEKKHPRWKGNKVGYWGIHDWITKHFGQPHVCENCGLKNQSRVYHWANLSHKYLRDRNDFKRMCVPCHRRYDYSRKEIEYATA